MKATKLRLVNFRCFEDLELSLDPAYGLHVIVADNMAGKSAIFQGLKVSLAPFINAITTTQIPIAAEDHRILGENPLSDRTLRVSVEAQFLMADGRIFEWARHKSRPDGRTILHGPSVTSPSNHGGGALFGRSDHAFAQEFSSGNRSLPILLFIGTEYVSVTASETSRFAEDFNRELGYNAALAGKSIETFLLKWYDRMDRRRAETVGSPEVGTLFGSLPQRAISNFQQHLKAVLPDIDQVSWLTAGRGSNRDERVMVIRFTDGRVRLWSQLSDGYRYLVLLVAEICMRGILLNQNVPGELSQNLEGIVMIDEFGIHLHPELQSGALTNLSKAFPKVQFIISTHSVMLLNGLKKEQIHLLEVDADGRRTVRHPDRDIRALGAEGILREVFGLESTFDQQTKDDAQKLLALRRKSLLGPLSPEEAEQFALLNDAIGAPAFDGSLHDPLYKRFLEALGPQLDQAEPNEQQVRDLVARLLNELSNP